MIDRNSVMPLTNIDDWEMRLDRQDACFNGAIIDRPVVVMNCRKPGSEPFPKKAHASEEERWFDVDYQVRKAKHDIENRLFFGDALPIAGPNLGPDYFPALFGGKITFEGITSYINHWLTDWSEWDEKIRYDETCIYFTKLAELYDAFLAEMKDIAYVGYPDIHTGSDCLAAFRDPLHLNFDTIEQPDEILKGLRKVTDQFYKTFDHYYDMLTAAGQPCASWTKIVSRYKYHIPSSDFSYMISPRCFDELFLEGLREENKYFEKNIHHLDGPGCRNHLESLLTIDEMTMVQWVWGAGNGRASDYLDVYKHIQSAGRGLQIWLDLDELDLFIEELKPEGVWMQVHISTPDQAEEVLKRVSRWTS